MSSATSASYSLLDDADGPAADVAHMYMDEGAEAPAASSSAGKKRGRPAAAARVQEEKAYAREPAAAAAAAPTGGRASRVRTAVNYAQLEEGDDAEGDAGEDGEAGSGGEGEAAPPPKKRRSTAAAPRRRRNADDDDDDEGYEQRHGEGERKSGARKQRTSAGGAARGKRGSASAIAAAAAATAMAASASGDLDMGEDEEPMDAAAARRFAAGPNAAAAAAAEIRESTRDSARAAECGILLSMRLRNFMNHKNFELVFNANVNFISGRNGAGKSAILHAIQVVFGSRASDTARAKKIGDLVHRGKEEASIELRIKNEGDGAFRHEAYGDVISIVRRIRRTGTSTYRLSNGVSGAEVSRSTAEVGDLCAHFNIQVSNPCVIMTQEVSKKFVQSQNPTRKFDFFEQATQLEWLRASLAEAHDNLESMKHTLAVQKDKIPQLEEKIKKLQHQEALAQETEQLEQDILHHQRLLVWRQVKEVEIQFDKKEADLEAQKADHAKAVAKRERLAASFGGEAALSEARATHTATIDQANRRAQSFAEQMSARDQDIVKVKYEQRALQGRVSQLEKRIAALHKRKTANDAKIRAIAEANQRDHSATDAARQKKSDALQAEKIALEKQKEQLQTELSKLMQEEMPLRLEAEELNRTAQEAHARFMQANGNLHRAQQAASQGGAAAAAGGKQHNFALGTHTAAIWAEIRKERRWKQQPMGPLGEHVQVKPEHESWLTAITECLTRKHMSSYVVDSFHDQQLLQRILSQVWSQTGERSFQPIVMILPRRARYKVTRPNVPFPIVLDYMEVDDDWAFNAILFNCKPERFALQGELRDAEAAIRPYRKSTQPPNSNDFVNGAFLRDGGKVSIRGTGAGAVTSERRSEKALFRVSQADRIRELEAAAAASDAEYKQAQVAAQEKKAKQNQITREAARVKGEQRELHRKLERIDTDQNALEDEADRERQRREKQDDTQYVQDNVDATNELAECEADLEKLRSHDEADFTRRIDTLVAERGKLERQMAAEEATAEDERQKLVAFTVQWSQDEKKLNRYIAKEKELEQAWQACEAELAIVSAHLQQCETEAIAMAPDRVDSPSSAKVLMARLAAKEDTLREQRKQARPNLSQVRLDLKEVQLEKERTESGMATVLENMDDLKKANKRRINKLMAYKKTLADEASTVFNNLLSQSGGSGRLEFDLRNRTLQLIVNPNVRDSEREDAADTVALSGGERSTTTIAFVMAVGEQVDCPFRAIDEFDVFMDPINRRQALNILFSIAKLRKDRQFLFLSPLDISGMADSEFFRVHKLTDPVRNQTTLDEAFERQMQDEEERKEGEDEA